MDFFHVDRDLALNEQHFALEPGVVPEWVGADGEMTTFFWFPCQA